jgi:hypothetical protein
MLTLVDGQDTEYRGGGVYPNLFDAHPPFQIDGNFGVTAGIAEMLVQSHANEIHLLPALPSCWPDGKVTGLNARGAIEVDLEWEGGRMKVARLRAVKSKVVDLRVGNEDAPRRVEIGVGGKWRYVGENEKTGSRSQSSGATIGTTEVVPGSGRDPGRGLCAFWAAILPRLVRLPCSTRRNRSPHPVPGSRPANRVHSSV